MRLEQLYSLSEDEIDILWFCINVVNPRILKKVELQPRDFVSIKHTALLERLKQCRTFVKEENYPLFDGLVEKLSVV